MTKLPEKEEIRLAIIEYKEAKGISQNALAAQTRGVSAAILSHIDSRNWEGISEEMWRRIWNKVSDVTKPGLFNTAAFETGLKACKSAQGNHFMIGLVADTGIGKTTVLQAYSMRKNVYYVAYDKTMKPRQFLIALLHEMGIDFESNINEMVTRLADELNALENPLIIIDEAGKLTHTMILYLHVLRDRTIKNCGIVLGGMPYFKSTIFKLANKGREGYAEFLRRVNIWQEMEGLSRIEIKAICEMNGITDIETVKAMYLKRRFGDLQNAILIHNIENLASHD